MTQIWNFLPDIALRRLEIDHFSVLSITVIAEPVKGRLSRFYNIFIIQPTLRPMTFINS